ncbi:MAG: histidine kinase [Proteobacteria bacterium]|nr:histidine kinase [Pseudomonadota bacterium]
MRANKASKFPWANPKSLTGRLLLASLLWLMLALTVGGILLSAAFRDHVETETDDRLSQTMDSMIGVSDIGDDGTIVFSRPLSDQRFNEPYSGWYWQISAVGQESIRSRSLWDQELTVDFSNAGLVRRTYEAPGPEGQTLRILEREILLPGTDRTFIFMMASDVSEMLSHIAHFNRIVIWSLGGLGFGIVVAMVLQVAFGLSPLRDVKTGLSEIREGNRKRLPQDCPPEIKPLVDEMNAVLAQNETLVERARTQMGNLAHSLKTPLSVISNEIASSRKTRFSELVGKQTTIIRRNVDHQLARARAIGHSRHIKAKTEVEVSIINVGRTIQRLYQKRNLELTVEIEPGLMFHGEKQDLEEILGNLLDNAAKWAVSKIRVTAKCKRVNGAPAAMILIVEDDGPGVDRNQRPSLYRRGKKMDEGVPGSGLGLAIVRDITQIYGGKAHLKRSKMGGLKVELQLPVATP